MLEKLFVSLISDVQIGSKTLACGTIYRSPSGNPDSHTTLINLFTSTLTKLIKVKQNSDCFLFGSFNYNILDTENNITSGFVDLMFEHTYFPLVHKTTRITSITANLPNHIWTNAISLQTIKSRILTYEISNHLPVLLSCTLNIPSQTLGFKYKRCFSDTNKSKVNSSLESVDITPVLNQIDPNISFSLFISL